MKYSIVIPCHNEGEGLRELVASYAEHDPHSALLEVIIVNDASTDNSGAILDELMRTNNFLRIITNIKSEGYGNAINSGLKIARGEFIGWTHGDHQTPAGDVFRAIEIINDSGAGENLYLKGERYGRPLIDQFFTIGMSLLETLYLRTPLWDINAQPNMFHRSFYESWINPPKDFSFDLFALYMARRAKLNIMRFPVHFGPRRYGSSTWNTGMKARIKFIKRTILFSKGMKPEMAKERILFPRARSDQSLGVFFLISVLISLLFLIADKNNLWQGMYTDMAPAMERLSKPDFLPTDFFTNASSQWNPRSLYVNLIVSTSKALNKNWETIQYTLLIFERLITPALFFAVAAMGIKRRLRDDRQLFVAFAILATITAFIQTSVSFKLISLASWGALPSAYATPDALAHMLGLAGIISRYSTRRFLKISLALSALATIIHPAVGIFLFAFETLLFYSRVANRQFITVGFATVLLPSVLIMSLFHNNQTLGSSEFVWLYTHETHSQHYVPSVFLSTTRVILILLYWTALIGASFIFYLKKHKSALLLALVTLGVHISIIAAQYLFIEVLPLRIVAEIGPVRFHEFFLWLFFIVITITLLELVPRISTKKILAISTLSNRNLGLLSVALAIAIALIAPFLPRDTSGVIRNEHKGLSAFISNTGKNSTFLLPPELSPMMFLISQDRPLYSAGNFTFYEPSFREHTERKSSAYGSFAELNKMKGTTIWDRSIQIYQNKTLSDFSNISKQYPLDYIVVSKNTNKISPASDVRPAYADETFLVYSTSSLRTDFKKKAQSFVK